MDFPNEITFMLIAVPRFVYFLGYSRSELFFEVALGTEPGYRADALVAAGRTRRPWILIETKVFPRHVLERLAEWKANLKTYRLIANAEYSILLSPSFMIIVDKKGLERIYSLRDLTASQAADICSLLKRPDTLPDDPLQVQQEYAMRDVPVALPNETFSIDLAAYSRHLMSVSLARTNDEKKNS
jgi:hypothetical protein